MRLFKLFATFVAAFALTLPCCAQRALPAADEAAVDATLTAFGTTLAKMDFATFGTLFTDDADFVNIVGMHWHGRAEIVKAHSVVFTTRYHGQNQVFVDRTVAELAPGVALVVGKIKLDDYTGRDGVAHNNNLFRMTMVLEKREGRWLIRDAGNTVVDPEAAKHDPIHPAGA